MAEPLSDLGLPALALITIAFVVAVRESVAHREVPGRQFLLTGAGLLLLGSILAVITEHSFFEPIAANIGPVSLSLVGELVGYLGGFLFLGLGLLKIATSDGARRRVVGNEAAQLQSTRTLLRCILQGSFDGIIVADAVRDQSRAVVDFQFRVVNRAAEQLIGRNADQLLGRSVLDSLPCLRQSGLLQELASVVETGLPIDEHKYRTFESGNEWYIIVASKLGDGVAVNIADVTKRKEAEDQLRYAAQHEPLTGLANRAHFAERLERTIVRARNQTNYRFGVLFLDFDRFKIINDSLGHDVGDELLRSIARRIEGLLSEQRLGTFAARIGGDEFLVLLEGPADDLELMAIADVLQDNLAQPHRIEGHDIVSTASIGVVTSDGGFESPEAIIKLADAAMYQSKQAGKGCNTLVDGRMRQEVSNRRQLEIDLRNAVSDGAFKLAFEPVVDLESGELVGCEALIRWPHPSRGVMFPAEFLSIVDEMGLGLPLGYWVIQNACNQLAVWEREFQCRGAMRMYVNLSRVQLADPELPTSLKKILEDYDLHPSSLGVEVTEEMMQRDATHLEQQLDALHALGVWTVMDDFGADVISLDTLRRLALNALKIDRQFLSGFRKQRDVATVVQAIVDLAHGLDIQVVAEGVETMDQIALVGALGCRYAQGHVFGRPDGLETVERLLRGEGPLESAA